jgi:Membrane-bound metallopeptidase
MPRGRHRHSPPLHRLLPPSAIAGVSLVCAAGPWLFTEPTVLRALAAAAAVTAVVGGVVMRRWDTAAGKRVADLTRARASDEWRHEERVAELETDLDESRELRTKLEHKLRAKRAELAGLRNEHAALLRRYATAETERASALEGRRLLEIETVRPRSRADCRDGDRGVSGIRGRRGRRGLGGAGGSRGRGSHGRGHERGHGR